MAPSIRNTLFVCLLAFSLLFVLLLRLRLRLERQRNQVQRLRLRLHEDQEQLEADLSTAIVEETYQLLHPEEKR